MFFYATHGCAGLRGAAGTEVFLQCLLHVTIFETFSQINILIAVVTIDLDISLVVLRVNCWCQSMFSMLLKGHLLLVAG